MPEASRAELSDVIQRVRLALVEEATPLPGSQLAYGRPHEHPRTRSFPRYSRSGRRIEGTTRIGPDCPRPKRGRCECPPDGSWRPSVGVVRADATANHAVSVPASRLRPVLEGDLWVADVYEKGPDGLWRCRWPARAALERFRGVSPRRWLIAIRILRGDHLDKVWGAPGAPPNAAGEAYRLLRQLETWTDQERVGEWEHRPRQWWDPPKKPRASNARPISKSQSQLDAELQTVDSAATVMRETEAAPGPRSASGVDPRSEPPIDSAGPRTLRATASLLDLSERACA